MTPAMTLFRGAQHDRQGRRHAGIRRRATSATRNIDLAEAEAAITPRTRADHADAFRRAAGGHGCAVRRWRDGAACASSRTRRWRSARQWRGAHRQLRRHRHVQLPSEQEHDDDRGRRARRQRCRRSQDASKRCAFTASSCLPDGTRDVAFPGGKFNLPDVNARVGLAQLAQLDAFTGRAARAGRALFRALRAPIPPACCRTAVTPATRRATAGTCSRRCCRSTAMSLSRAGIPRRARRAGHRHRRIVRSRASRHAFRVWVTAMAISRIPSVSPSETVTLPLFPDHDRRPTSTACATPGRRHRILPPLRALSSRWAHRYFPSSSRSTTRRTDLPRCSRACIPRWMRCGVPYEVIFVNDGSRDRSAALLREQFQRRPDVTRVVLFNANYGQHPGDHCRLPALPRRTHRHARRRPAESTGGNRHASGGDGCRPRLRGRRAAHARGFVVAPLGLAGDEPAARADHAHQDDRPGLHAARLQPGDHRCRRGEPRGEHLSFPRSPTRSPATRSRSKSGTRNAPRGNRSIRCTSSSASTSIS